jgi:GT2 family glycosyltransferase
MGDSTIAAHANRVLPDSQGWRRGESLASPANAIQINSRPSDVEPESPLVYVSVLNWNGYSQTEECLASLFGMDYPNYKVVILDNGSTDGSVAHLAKWTTEYPDRVTLLTSESNAGFTAGHNLVMNYALAAGADYVWLVNSDVTVLPDALSALIEATRGAANIGLLSPLAYYTTYPDRVWNCGALRDVENGRSTPTEDIATARKWLETEPDKFVVWGAAMLISRNVIESIGLLDERFFAYCEDVDYSIRSLEAGFRNILVEAAVVYHDKSLSASEDFTRPYYHYFDLRNNFLLMSKHSEKWRGLKGKLWYTRRVLRRLEQWRGKAAIREASLTALWDIWCGRTGGFDPLRRMPWPLRPILGSWPGFWRRLLEAI